MGIRVTVVGADAIAAAFDRAASGGSARRAMSATVLLIQGAVMLGSPVGVTSLLRGSWASEVRGTGALVEGIVGSPLIYAEVIERGRRAGARMPPSAALESWVRTKMGPEVSAFVVARSIGRKGIAPRHMLKTAVEATRPTWQRLFADIVARIEGA